MGRHLLIVSCSDKKDTRAGLMPAIERYKGAWYGVINKLKREGRLPDNLDILIISAKYGLIDSHEKIENYDQRMDAQRAKELRDSVTRKLKAILLKSKYESVLINLGSAYMEAVSGFEKLISNSTKVIICKGKIGERKRDMRKWIESVNQFKRC